MGQIGIGLFGDPNDALIVPNDLVDVVQMTTGISNTSADALRLTKIAFAYAFAGASASNLKLLTGKNLPVFYSTIDEFLLLKGTVEFSDKYIDQVILEFNDMYLENLESVCD